MVRSLGGYTFPQISALAGWQLTRYSSDTQVATPHPLFIVPTTPRPPPPCPYRSSDTATEMVSQTETDVVVGEHLWRRGSLSSHVLGIAPALSAFTEALAAPTISGKHVACWMPDMSVCICVCDSNRYQLPGAMRGSPTVALLTPPCVYVTNMRNCAHRPHWSLSLGT